jgi:hypothetical protein
MCTAPCHTGFLHKSIVVKLIIFRDLSEAAQKSRLRSVKRLSLIWQVWKSAGIYSKHSRDTRWPSSLPAWESTIPESRFETKDVREGFYINLTCPYSLM